MHIFTAGETISLEDFPEDLFSPTEPSTGEAFLEGSAEAPGSPASGGQDGDLQTAFYVNFKSKKVRNEHEAEFQRLTEEIRTFRAWADAVTATTLEQAKNTGKLDGKSDNQIASYRAKVINTVLRQRTTFLASGAEVLNSSEFDGDAKNLHKEIILLALRGFPVPDSTVAILEGLLQEIINNINKTEDSNNKTQWWILMSVMVYDEIARIVVPKIRTITFQTNVDTKKVIDGKNSSHRGLKMTMDFSGMQWDFSSTLWNQISDSVKAMLAKKGVELANVDIGVEVDID